MGAIAGLASSIRHWSEQVGFCNAFFYTRSQPSPVLLVSQDDLFSVLYYINLLCTNLSYSQSLLGSGCISSPTTFSFALSYHPLIWVARLNLKRPLFSACRVLRQLSSHRSRQIWGNHIRRTQCLSSLPTHSSFALVRVLVSRYLRSLDLGFWLNHDAALSWALRIPCCYLYKSGPTTTLSHMPKLLFFL